MKIGATCRIELRSWESFLTGKQLKKIKGFCVKEKSDFIDGESYYILIKDYRENHFSSFTIRPRTYIKKSNFIFC